ncbi:PAS domain S-box protein [Leptothoe sp. PORK10 BA2]|uniref:PAS domain S-box protein n=1 Tax=Leptothoe sp. PORK10 BA2 TaxID=3110254 RepID=UPI002B1EFAA8|nr:PAS domain S-box protein [Leptothoe sp. PORK10 BA2]MEA5462550.1 PAS domain S-box protein [Leptothoe sp. PORK10 BA2]
MLNRAKILAIDDQAENLDFLTEMLSGAGYDVVVAMTIEGAMDSLRPFYPDLILLNSQILGLNGGETCGQIKANPETAHIPIIFLTILADQATYDKWISLGVADFIRQPVQAAELLARVRTQLELSQVKQLYEREQKKTAELTRLNEGLLLTQFSVDNLADGIIWVDQDAQLFYANATAYKMLQYSFEDLARLSLPDIDINFSPQHWQQHWQDIKQFKSFTLETQYRTNHGHVYAVEATINYLLLAGQECNVIVFRDISARKQIEAALQLSQARTEAVFEQAALGFVEADMTSKKITRVNTLFCEMIGYNRAELAELTFLDLTHPDDRLASKQSMQQLYKGEIDRFTVEKRYVRKDGTWFWAETTVYLVKLPGNRAVYSLGLIQDITERKATQKMLSLTKFAIDHTATNTFWLNQEGYFTFVNKAACEALGYSYDELTHMAVWDIDVTGIQDRWPAHWQSLQSDHHQQFESIHQRKDGDCFPVEIVVDFLEFEGEQYNFAQATDITARKAVEAKMHQKNQELEQTLAELQATQLQLVQQEKMSALGNLVAGVAHEINNPVGFVGGNLAELKSCLADLTNHLDLYQQQAPAAEIANHARDIDLEYLLDDIPKMLKSMEVGCDLIRNISISLRTFSRTDKDSKTAFDLHEGLDSTLLILKHRLKANESRPAIKVYKNYGSLPEVLCFPGQLNQVFMNILANAIDALDENSQGKDYATLETQPNHIVITTELHQDQVLVRIQDNGPGIPETVKPHIFDHLYTTKDVGKGTGLGLAIAQQIIVETHGGEIVVKSNPGEGSEFALQLPVVG